MISDRGALRRAPRTTQPTPATPTRVDESWRAAAFLPLKRAATILGVSPASIYKLEAEKQLKFRRIAGRTLVAVAGIAAIVDRDEPWTPSKAGEAARARRAELARANWEGADAA